MGRKQKASRTKAKPKPRRAAPPATRLVKCLGCGAEQRVEVGALHRAARPACQCGATLVERKYHPEVSLRETSKSARITDAVEMHKQAAGRHCPTCGPETACVTTVRGPGVPAVSYAECQGCKTNLGELA